MISVWIGIAVLVFVLSLFLFRRYQTRRIVMALTLVSTMLRIGTYSRLLAKFRASGMSEKNAGNLASSVVLRVFLDEPDNEEIKAFMKANRKLIENELVNLRGDPEIMQALEYAVQLGMGIKMYSGVRDEESLHRLADYLAGMGLLPDREGSLADPGEIIEWAKKYSDFDERIQAAQK